MIISSVVAVTGVPTLLAAADPKRDFIQVRNADAGTEIVKLGGVDVAFATGYGVPPGGTFRLDSTQFSRSSKSDLYAISDGTSVNVEVITGVVPSL